MDTDLSAFAGRLSRAHATCYENLGVFCAIALAASLTENTGVTRALATVLVGARVAHATIHVRYSSAPAVIMRFDFFAVHLGVQIYWAAVLLNRPS